MILTKMIYHLHENSSLEILFPKRTTMKRPFCNRYTRVWYVPFHKECMERVEIEGDEEERQEMGKMKRKMTVDLIDSIINSRIALFRANGPIAKK